MRPSGSLSLFALETRYRQAVPSLLLCVGVVVCSAGRLAGQKLTAGSDQLRAHDSVQWRDVEAHLPNPHTASPQVLEQQADILRARRFPEDALDFYRYALDRGAKPSPVLNKIGLTELEMKNVELARMYFQRAVKLDPRNADAWNNLGAVEYIDRGAAGSIGDYKRAIKLDKHQAVFHANLATQYFELRNYKGARRELAEALKLNPAIFENRQSAGGVQAHVLTSEGHARFAFEMARMYAGNKQEEEMLHSLAMASEYGMDVQREMRKDVLLAQYENDPRVIVLVHNAQVIRGKGSSVSASSAEQPSPASEAPKAVSE